MAWVNGENQNTPSVGRSLARHKMKHPEQPQAGGGGKEMTITEKPEGGFHTVTKGPEGEKHADHPTMEHAVQHMHQHFGHKGKPEHEQMGEEAPPMPEQGGGLESMGIASA